MGVAVCLVVLGAATGTARADESAARILESVWQTYRSGPIDEVITVEVRGQGEMADLSAARLRLDLAQPGDPSTGAPSTRPCLEFRMGPVRAVATWTNIAIVHATDPEQYVGVSLDRLTIAELERVIPTPPIPQLAIALSEPTGDTLAIGPHLPPITLHEVARGDTTVTLSGRDGPLSVTLIIGLDRSRIERFEATIPAESGWYDLVVTAAQAGDPSAGAIEPLAVEGRQRVTRVADLRPRGLVLVPEAELGWLPVTPLAGRGSPAAEAISGLDEQEPLARLLDASRPTLVAFVGINSSPERANQWIDEARAATELFARLPTEVAPIVLVFDPSGHLAGSASAINDAIAASGVDGVTWLWVDGRAVSLERALPRLDPGVMAVTPAGHIIDVARIPQDDAGRADVLDRLRRALGRE